MPDSKSTALTKQLLMRALDEVPNYKRFDVPNIEVIRTGEGPESMIPVPRPPQFQPYPDVRGGHKLAQHVDDLLKFAPALQGHLPRIQNGPNADVIDDLARDGYAGEDWEDLNLVGATGKKNQHIAINPRVQREQDRNGFSSDDPDGPYTMPQVLGHEAMHAIGYPDKVAYSVDKLIRSLKGPLKR